jgi:uncharacterized membrane protein YgaE (UPF0421/DUF939 family)
MIGIIKKSKLKGGFMKLHKPGMRTIKTALAVVITLFIGDLLSVQSPFFAAIAAIISMESSVSESFKSGRNRIFGTILGGGVALIFSLTLPTNAFVIGIGIIVVIYLCNLFGWKDTIKISSFVFLSILLNYESGSQLNYVLHRTLDTFLGLTIGTLVNFFVLPHNVQGKVVDSINKIYSQLKSMLESIIWQDQNINIEQLRKELIRIEESYVILKSETRLHAAKDDSSLDYKRIFIMFENTYNHLSIITTIEKNPVIDESNRISLEELFKRQLPEISRDIDHLDPSYNYHLSKAIDNIKLLERMIIV